MLLDLVYSFLDGTEAPAFVLVKFLMVLVIVVFSLSLHECAHAFAAKKLGDFTAYHYGRMTLNPLKHLDPAGFLMMAVIGIGFAKPVPINPRNFRDPRKGMMLSSLAGPLSNFLVAVVATWISVTAVYCIYPFIAVRTSGDGADYMFSAMYAFFYYMAYLNFALAIFNLIPCPPFDGSRIFFYFLPKDWYFRVMRYERYLGIGMLVLFILLGYIGLDPVSFIAHSLIDSIGSPIAFFFELVLK